ncbi:metallophosphoesterase [Naasia sp. SYSU D00057]|uniref:metallophosphoesterase n=1 Tax=Naasia sp. SYSU D00057 TaxID=2817380 RepID=UPI001B314DAD|nr:metallophosphoesterase [Naasia sp. SYSU D00057]
MKVRRVVAIVGVLLAVLCAGAAIPLLLERASAGPEPDARQTDQQQESELVFTTSGDFNDSSKAEAVFEGIADLDPDLHIALGDLSYGDPGEEQAWCRMVVDAVGAGFPFELLAGNHESDGSDGVINDFAACLPNQLPGAVGTYARQYYVDVPQEAPIARFVLISPGLTFPDGTDSYDEGSSEYEWAQEAIEGARDADIPWVVVAMHKPCLSIGEYRCDPGEDIIDLLVDERVDLVLSGHEHLYQRTAQLATGGGCAAIRSGEYSADCVADEGDTLEKGAGTVFATVGTGGQDLREVYEDDPEAPYMVATHGAGEDATWGSLEVTLTPAELSARFVPATGGDFTDRFSIGG